MEREGSVLSVDDPTLDASQCSEVYYDAQESIELRMEEDDDFDPDSESVVDGAGTDGRTDGWKNSQFEIVENS